MIRTAYLLLAVGTALPAQQGPDFAAYTGRYAYHGGSTIDLAPAPTPQGMQLVAILDEAKYPLRWVAGDRFLNGIGDTIPFRRDGRGRVVAFAERGAEFRRLADTVSREVLASLVARAEPFAYRPPADVQDGLAVGTLADAGLTPATAELIGRRVVDGTYADVDGILVYRNGRLVMEEYFYGYHRDRGHQLRSASKSVVSALVGLAIDAGKLSGDTMRVLPHLPYGAVGAYANPDPRKADITLGHLLSMRTGLACNDWDAESPGNEVRIYETADWPKAVLDLPLVREPGGEARYCSGAVLVAGRMVERAVGATVPEYAQRALFTPLGIRAADVRWNYTLDRSNNTFAQLVMRPRDLLKLGVLYKDGGRWRGQQIISRDWVERSTARVTGINTRGYGYVWWHQTFDVATPGGPRRVTAVNASGNGGQKLYIMPELDLVVVFTGSNYNSDRDTPPNAIMADVLLPALLAAPGAR